MFDHMAKELDAIPAAGCTIENDYVSFLKQIVYPMHETLAAEAAGNNNGKAAHFSVAEL
ncbi:putative 1,3-beta-glucan synthase [Rosa chinensis]|uniref:Putative 1,3-beta-glucan synthase n=1 Tax=Rosa chinensis TaxID=74649 RepID=A0A2P6RGU0_ROSCH|nr:putative 1,3-beta-glucan synthase [Rosa chinensis]